MGHLASNFQSSGSGFPLTRALNFGTNADRWCVAHVFFTSGLTFTSVTVNGVALTQRATASGMGGGTHRVFEGSVSGTGSLNVEATGTGAGVCWMTCSAYDGITGYRAGSAALKTSTAGTDNITSPTTVSGDLVWCGGNDNTAGATFAGTSGTSTLAANAGEFALGKTATSTSTQLDFTISPSGSWQGGVLALEPTAVPDTTAPTLSSPSGAATGKDAGSGTVTTDEANGTLYSVVTLTSTPPSASQVKAGQNASGASLAAGLKPTLAISSTGAKTVAYTGLTSGTPYFPYFMHEDAATNQSTVSAGASFTPSTMAYSGTIGAQTGTQGGTFVWSGANPSTLFSGGVGTRSFSGTGLSGSGLTVNSSTGVLSGTCGTAGTYTVAIVGTDQSTAGTEVPQTETSNSFTLTISASGDTTRPILGGVVTFTPTSSTTATATWPAGSDNSGTIGGYDYQLNGGSFVSLSNVLTVDLTGLTPSTAYTMNVRARDPSGNLSTPVITGGGTMPSGTAGTITSPPLKRNSGVSAGVASLAWVGVRNRTTGADVAVKTGVSTNGSGVFSVTDAAFVSGTYHVTWIESTGASGWFVATV